MSAAEELEEIVSELQNLSERISDLAISTLREAVQAGETKRPELERQLSRARSGIERAIAILARRAQDDEAGQD